MSNWLSRIFGLRKNKRKSWKFRKLQKSLWRVRKGTEAPVWSPGTRKGPGCWLFQFSGPKNIKKLWKIIKNQKNKKKYRKAPEKYRKVRGRRLEAPGPKKGSDVDCFSSVGPLHPELSLVNWTNVRPTFAKFWFSRKILKNHKKPWKYKKNQKNEKNYRKVPGKCRKMPGRQFEAPGPEKGPDDGFSDSVHPVRTIQIWVMKDNARSSSERSTTRDLGQVRSLRIET